MKKSKPYSAIWYDLKKCRSLIVFVHPGDVSRVKGNLIKNKHRDVPFNIEYPSARLSFTYSLKSLTLEVKLSLTMYDEIPLTEL